MSVEKIAYRVTEAVEVSGIGRTALYERMASGELESITVGRRRLIPRAALEDYIERLRGEQQHAGNAA